MVKVNNPLQLGPPPTQDMRSLPKAFVRWCERMWKEKLNINRSGSEETGWTDALVNVSSIRTAGVGVPTFEQINGSNWWGLAFTDEITNQEKRVIIETQLSHGVQKGTPINVHIHYVTEGAVDPDENVRWEASTDILFGQGQEVSAAAVKVTTTDVPVLARYGAYSYRISQIVVIASEDIQESTLFSVFLRRKSGDAADTYDGNTIWILSADGHIRMEKVGSYEEFPGALE